MNVCIITEDDGVIYEAALNKRQIKQLMKFAESLSKNEMPQAMQPEL